MIIQQTETYKEWFEKQKDIRLIARIQIRLKKLGEDDYFGDSSPIKPVSYGVSELRIHYGAGYRIYYKRKRNNTIVLLLCAGSKSSQKRDAERALRLAEEN